MRSALCLWPFLAISLYPLAAQAAEEEVDRDVTGGFHAQLGGGGGTTGLATHAGIVAQGWVTDHVAVGGGSGFGASTQIFGDSASWWYIGPLMALRTSAGGTYAFMMASAGFASRTTHPGSSCVLAEHCAPPTTSHKETGAAVGLAGGVAFHAGHFEIGPVVRVDHIAGGNVLTLNLVLGAVVTRSPQ